MGWVNPTSYSDPDSKWFFEPNAYDDSLSCYAECTLPAQSWGKFLELTHSAMYCSKVRFYAIQNAGWVNQIDIDAYYDSTWNHVYSGFFADQVWIEKSLPSVKIITAFRFSFYSSCPDEGAWGRLVEVDFYEQFIAPTVTTQAATDITHNSATGNGNITATGGENATERGFEYKEGAEGEVSKVYDTGNFGTGAFSKGITDLKPGTLYYVRAYAKNSAGTGYGDWVSFTTDKTTPTVTTQDATEVSQNQVKGNGNITCAGGENCTERGFEYGYTKTDTWTKKETGSYEAGAFNLTIDSLQANTEYWYRAYAVNSIGTGYGEWVKFQTSATGVIPTGTKLSICSDYSGYTYKLNSAFTDDGNGYESYFVLSTDLAQKQGLHIYKRLEDIFSYFAKKESGTAKIYIKRDNEAEWQYAGEISMVGDEDIIVKHLPSENVDSVGDVDFLAKHFLIKFVFENDFEFIGLISEAIPEGVR